MKTLPNRLLTVEAALASSTTVDRRLMDRAFAMMGGMSPRRLILRRGES